MTLKDIFPSVFPEDEDSGKGAPRGEEYIFEYEISVFLYLLFHCRGNKIF